MKKPFAEIRDRLPQPVCDEHPEFTELYWAAWKLAYDHVRHIPGMPQDPYMDEAFCDSDIWIWDTCFMSLFCKFAPQELFPGSGSLQNFYHVLYDHGTLPEITYENVPEWTGCKPGDRGRIQIHIADNPPLFAWAEYENALFTGDTAHIRELLLEKQYLQKHYDFIENLTEPVTPPGVRNVTCLLKRPLGYLWEGGRSGMDNTPRGRTGEHAEKDRPNNPDLLWVDAICQQALSAYCIARMAEWIGETGMAAVWQKKYEEKQDTVRQYYWDVRDQVFYDIDQNIHDFCRVLTPASFWPLTAHLADEQQARGMARTVEDSRKLGGRYPWVTLSRDDADFNAADGHYWRGSVWLPTAYAGLRGCVYYGYYDLARETGIRLIDQMYRTWKDFEPHTIWECYAPNACEPAHGCGPHPDLVRPNFCGWSALGPIAVYLEFVIGIYSVNAFTRQVKWHLPAERRRKTGVRNLQFADITADLIAEKDKITVRSSGEFELEINGRKYSVPAGTSVFSS